MIQPTVGRVVWFWPFGQGDNAQPYRADVCFVHNDRQINISYNDHNGHPGAAQEIRLLQEGDEVFGTNYCTWMPYQVASAKEKNPVSGDKANVSVDDKVANLLKS